MSLTLVGVDFTSRPTPRKPITVALGTRIRDRVRLDALESHASLGSWSTWLKRPEPWLGAFDLPFGLPRELVLALGWPTTWLAMIRHYASRPREEIRQRFKVFCAARPVGHKFAHPATDLLAGSSPSMKWVNPPVAFMCQVGVPLLIDAGVTLPGVHLADPGRVALEGYPGLLAREVLGRTSYKSDTRAMQTPARQRARKQLLTALAAGRTRLAVRLELSRSQRTSLESDPSGDRLDAVLCLLQAAWASRQPHHGQPQHVDELEGWIVTTQLT